MKQREMVNVSVWALCLCDNQNSAKYFYNSNEQIFQLEFTSKCAFLDEKSAVKEKDKLSLDELEVIKGTMEYPEDLLTKAIIEKPSEKGLSY